MSAEAMMCAAPTIIDDSAVSCATRLAVGASFMSSIALPVFPSTTTGSSRPESACRDTVANPDSMSALPFLEAVTIISTLDESKRTPLSVTVAPSKALYQRRARNSLAAVSAAAAKRSQSKDSTKLRRSTGPSDAYGCSGVPPLAAPNVERVERFLMEANSGTIAPRPAMPAAAPIRNSPPIAYLTAKAFAARRTLRRISPDRYFSASGLGESMREG